MPPVSWVCFRIESKTWTESSISGVVYQSFAIRPYFQKLKTPRDQQAPLLGHHTIPCLILDLLQEILFDRPNVLPLNHDHPTAC